MGKSITVELADAEITWRWLAKACRWIHRDIQDHKRALENFGANDPARSRYHARIAELDQGYQALLALLDRMYQVDQAAKKETRNA